MKNVLIAVLVLGCLASLLWAAYLADEHRKGIHTVVVENPAGDVFTVRLEGRERGDVLIQCHEEEFQGAFELFADFAGLEDVDPLTVPGGPKALAFLPGTLPAALEPAQRSLVELLERHAPRRIVLLGHSECLLYDVPAAWRDELARVHEEQVRDLERATENLHAWLPSAQIEAYYAMRDGELLRFHPWTGTVLQPELAENGSR